MSDLFRDSLCDVLVNTTLNPACFLLEFGLGSSAVFEGSRRIFCTGMYPFWGAPGLAECAELQFLIPSAVDFFS
jgi:hypothetical protein